MQENTHMERIHDQFNYDIGTSCFCKIVSSRSNARSFRYSFLKSTILKD